VTRLGLLWFRLRTLFVNLVVAAGVLAIVWLQWPQAVQSNCFAASGCSQGVVGTVLLEIIMAGIPAILFAIVAHAGLTWLLFRPKEVADYRRRKIVADVTRDIDAAPRADAPARRFEE